MEELLNGAGDGAVAVKRGRLEGVDDTVLLPITHLAVTRKLESESSRDLLEAIVARLEDEVQSPAALDTGREFRQNTGPKRPETEPVHEPQSP
jgi:hypothetical protein